MSVSGGSAVIGNLESLLAKYQKAAGRAIQNAAKDCYQFSQDTCPVGNSTTKSSYHQGAYQGEVYTHVAGTLKGSGKINKIDDFNVEVSYGGESDTGEYCDYALFVELGTYKMAAQSFLYPAFLDAVDLLSIDLQGISRLNAMEGG